VEPSEFASRSFAKDAYWIGFFMPKGTPEPIVTALNGALRTAMGNKNVQERIQGAAATIVGPDQHSSDYLRKFFKAEVPKWASIMKAANVEQQSRRSAAERDANGSLRPQDRAKRCSRLRRAACEARLIELC
jgi:hypothetical protein